MSIEAMKQALEALETVRHQNMSPQIHPAKVALRAAIAEAEKVEPVAEVTCFGHDADIHPMITYNARLMCNFEAGNYPLYTTPQHPAIPAGWQLVPVEPIKTGDPEISREHLVAIAEKCGLLGAYRTREVVDAIVGYGQVILRDKAVQEAMYRAALAAAPKPVAHAWQPTNEELTTIYMKANGIEGKNPPITTERIFTAMRAMLAAAPKPENGHE